MRVLRLPPHAGNRGRPDRPGHGAAEATDKDPPVSTTVRRVHPDAVIQSDDTEDSEDSDYEESPRPKKKSAKTNYQRFKIPDRFRPQGGQEDGKAQGAPARFAPGAATTAIATSP
mmetsp:Transcript_16628/g.45259  ORF Transcript_16628/g.45259 Transcript_16628/m.45259 type:complete len:115 (-) Transcript_16628:248-592(-)